MTTKSADAPWENGCSEALIKSVKRCLASSIGTNVLSYSELQTVLFDIADLLNERPIGLQDSNPEEGKYLCPNDMIMGRTKSKPPSSGWLTNDNRCRMEFINEIEDSFWSKWVALYFPTLIIRKKWHTDTRNLQIGDIVIVQDTKIARSEWRLAQVCKADPGADGKVRDVTLRYKQQSSDRTYEGVLDTEISRPVHKLVLISPVEDQKGL